MNIVYLIGNGFDVKHGLKTEYSNFYKSAYSPVDGEDEDINKLKNEIYDNDTWADLEKQIGKYSSEVDSEETYLKVFKDVRSKLAIYISEQVSDIQLTDPQRDEFIRSFESPKKYLKPGEIDEMNSYLRGTSSGQNVDFITFNYTPTLERFLNYEGGKMLINKPNISIDSIEHIHGDPSNTFVLGVDNINQITNTSFRSDRIAWHVVKITQNEMIKNKKITRCKGLIDTADVICLYGMSIGATDRTWWNHIACQVHDKNKRLIIFWWDKDEIDSRYCGDLLEKEAKVKDIFLSETTLDAAQKEIVKSRTYVVYKNEDIFNFTLDSNTL